MKNFPTRTRQSANTPDTYQRLKKCFPKDYDRSKVVSICRRKYTKWRPKICSKITET